MIIRILYAYILGLFSFSAVAQIGGRSVVNILNVPSSAMILGMGGAVISVDDNNLTLLETNPGILNASMHNHILLDYNDYFSDVSILGLTYAYSIKNNTFATQFKYINYGTFEQIDLLGTIIQEFTVNEYVLKNYYAYAIDSVWKAGMVFNIFYGDYYQQDIFGFSCDFSLMYITKNEVTLSAKINNLGLVLSNYLQNRQNEYLPLNFQIGITKKMKYAPFSFSAVYRDIQMWNLTRQNPYFSQTINPFTGQIESQDFSWTDQLIRHFIFSVQIFPRKHFSMYIGLNMRRFKELSIAQVRESTGFSGGIKIRLRKKHELNFSFSNLHKGFVLYNLSLVLDANTIYRRN